MTINDLELSELTLIIRNAVEACHMAQREGNYLDIIRQSSIIEDSARKIGWKAVDLEKRARYLAS